MAINPTPQETPTDDGNPTAGEAIKSANPPASPTPDKEFPNMHAAYARCGHELHGTDPADGPVMYRMARWGLVRELPTLRDAELFLLKVEGRQ